MSTTPMRCSVGQARSPRRSTGAFAYRVVGDRDAVEPGVFVLGLQLSSVQWGVAIAAEADAPAHLGARTLADADQVARAILAG